MIYLDNAATTKPSKNALDYVSSQNDANFFNPSALYKGGLETSSNLNKARESVLKAVGATNSDYRVIFTSCGSESDNLAIFGNVKKGVFVTDKGEHSAVHKSFLEQSARGNVVEFIDVNKDGSVNTDNLYKYVENNKVDFVSIVHVNNETGAINDVNAIADRLKKINPKIIFHTDGVQAFCKIPYRISKNVDYYAVSAHKINGLKGTGALIAKKKLNLNPIIFGGGQESGVRSGTENVFGISVFDYVIKEHIESLKQSFDHVSKLKQLFLSNLDKTIFEVISGDFASPYIVCVSAKGLKGEVLLHMLENYNIIIGNGSACSSRNRYSRTIEACGYKSDVLDGVIRVSFSAENNEEEVLFAVTKLNEESRRLKGIML